MGDTIPDGWWYGLPSNWGPSSFEFDVICVYTGAAGQQRRAECSNDPEPENCFAAGSDNFWVVNNSERTRVVPVSGNIEIFNPQAGDCPGWDIRVSGFDSLIQIVNGQAVYLTSPCPSN